MAYTNYSALIEDYLETKFSVNITQIERSWFKLPSGAIMYVNGSKLLVTQGDSYGWYDLGLKEYQKLITNSKHYYVVILDRPELTFILPPGKVKEIFGEVSVGDDNEWHYKLRKKSNR